LTGRLIGLGCRFSALPPWTHHPFASLSGVSAMAPMRLSVLARDRPAAPKQSAEPGTTGKLRTTGPMQRICAIGRLS